jgi:predicted anti-sigma-YlaC factor YlaD
MRGLISLGILLVVLWAVAWLVFKTAGFLIHLLLVVGAIMLIVGLVKRAGRAVSRDV